MRYVVLLVCLVACSDNSLSVASWNLQVFGDKKASNELLVDELIDIISGFDVVFVQEIRDVDNSAFNLLCDRINTSGLWGCISSEPLGRTHAKERYGVFFRLDRVNIIGYRGWSDDLVNAYDFFERPPWSVKLSFEGLEIEFIVVHTKPVLASEEIRTLLAVVGNFSPVIILGDLNADCDYAKPDFSGFNVHITSDTTVSKSDCAYDRILSKGVKISDSGVVRTTTISDHYPVFIKLSS